MSYILDALQRADAERARGGVPTLHARPVSSPPLKRRMGTLQRLGLPVVVVGVVLAVAAAGWWMWRPAATPAAVVVALTPSPAPAVTMPMAPLPQPVAMPAAPIAAPTAAAVPYPTAALPAPTPARAAVIAITPPTPRKSKSTASAAEPASPAVALPAPTQGLAPLLSELPEATRRQVPSMTISGAVYSDNPAQRLLLVNGQVLNQGSQVAPDLTVVEIHANNSEFNFRGTRFRMAH